MNKTLEKAMNALSESERQAILNCRRDPERTGDDLLQEALVRLYIILHDRKDGELTGLSPFEERVLARAVAAGNACFETDTYR